MIIKSKCPHCDQHYEINNQYIGQVVVCQKCHNEFKVDPIQPPSEPLQSNADKTGKRSFFSLQVGLMFVCLSCIAITLVLFVINLSLKKQIASLKSDIEGYQKNIDELKFGPTRLKGEADAAVSDGDLDKAKKIFEDLFARHPHKKTDHIYKCAFDDVVKKITERDNIIAQRKAQQQAALLANVEKKYDNMESATWYNTKRDCKYVTEKGRHNYPDEYYEVELYAGHFDSGNKSLRLRTYYYGRGDSRTWIFYEKIQIKGSNGKSVYINTKYPEKKSEFQHGAIQEWSDNYVKDISKDLAEIAQSDTIFVKFYGKYPFEFTMTAEQSLAFKEIIAIYNSL